MKKIISMILTVLVLLSAFAGCAAKKETLIIYSCANEKRIAHLSECLNTEFPQYEIIVEYMGTSKLAAKLTAEGKNTDADIVHDLLSLNMEALAADGNLADISFINSEAFIDEFVNQYYLPDCITTGAIIVNNEVIRAKNLPMPTSYEDLLKPEYKGLISMPDPKASGTGYMFLKSLVNAWGEEKAIAYFEQLSENVLQFTSSGNGPINALMQQEVAIGLGMTQNAVAQIDEGADLSILFFEEGAPISMYCQSIIAGKEDNEAVKEVFTYMMDTYMFLQAEKFSMEQIYEDKVYTSSSYPANVPLADMSNDNHAEKERILALWNIT